MLSPITHGGLRRHCARSRDIDYGHDIHYEVKQG